MRPRWAELEAENPWLKTETYDYDKDRGKAEEFDVVGGKLPVFVFLDKKGKELLRLNGEISKPKLEEVLRKNKDH